MKTVLICPSNPGGSAYLKGWGFLPAPLGLLQLAGSHVYDMLKVLLYSLRR
jgi:hypothetical protein